MYIIIGGGGKIAEHLAQTLLNKKHEVAVIELRDSIVNSLLEKLTGRVMVIQGDCCDSEVLEDAGIKEADIFVATTGKDDDNLVACEVASTLYETPRIIARVNNPKNERIFRNLGIEAISSTTIISRMIEEEAVQDDIRMVMSLRQGDLTMMDLELPHKSKMSTEGGRRVADIELPPSTVLVAVARSGANMLETVHGETVLLPGDRVVLCVRTDMEHDARQALMSI